MVEVVASTASSHSRGSTKAWHPPEPVGKIMGKRDKKRGIKEMNGGGEGQDSPAATLLVAC